MTNLWVDYENVKAINIMMRMAKDRLEAGRSPLPFYRTAGQHLARLRHGRDEESWEKIVRDECGMEVEYAHELISLSVIERVSLR